MSFRPNAWAAKTLKEMVPAGQAVHSVEPTLAAMVPTGQGLQLAVFGEAENKPWPHGLHPPPWLLLTAAVPAGHGKQSDADLASGFEDEYAK